MVFLVVIYLFRWENSRDETGMTILPLNGGRAIYLDAGGRKNDWLIDCGNEIAVNLTLKNFLRAQGVNGIPRLILTEGDAKNCGGAKLLDQLFGVGELWTSGAKFRSAIYRDAVAGFETPPSRRSILNRGDEIGPWKILWPAGANDFTRSDDNALVMLGTFSSAKILLLSDLGRSGQSGLLAVTNDLRADIVVCGLPDEGEPLSDALIDVIQPKVIVIADSDFPVPRRANSALKERLAQRQIPVIYTRDSGAVKIVSGNRGWKLEAMDGQVFIGGDVRSLPPK
jgi:beta-lactamase superfamily II metal-dependent hydrolase